VSSEVPAEVVRAFFNAVLPVGETGRSGSLQDATEQSPTSVRDESGAAADVVTVSDDREGAAMR
jgi:hypothetical protein